MDEVLRKLFKKTVDDIKAKYKHLDYDQGWRFLYGPKATLSKSTRIMFVGTNPAGRSPDRNSEDFILASQERGDAHRREVEQWKGKGKVLQREVSALFKRLSHKIEGRSPDMNFLMRESVLTSNFCPFRSEDWSTLDNRPDATDFSNELWEDILPRLDLSLVICMGNNAHTHMKTLLQKMGFPRSSDSKPMPTGWGDRKYEICYLTSEDGRGRMMLVKIPHLSVHTVMTRRESDRHTDKLLECMADWLNRTSQ